MTTDTNNQKKLLCSRCKMKYYESKAEQILDYKYHKDICKTTAKIRKEQILSKEAGTTTTQKMSMIGPALRIDIPSACIKKSVTDRLQNKNYIKTRKQKNEEKSENMEFLTKFKLIPNPSTGDVSLHLDHFLLPLDFMLTSMLFLESFGPTLDQNSQWNLGPSELTLHELSASFLINDDVEGINYEPKLVPFNTKLIEASLVIEHQDSQIPLPTQMLEIHFSALDSCDFEADSDVEIFARPENRPKNISMMDWWAMYTSGKSDLFNICLDTAMTMLSEIRVFTWEGELVEEWGMVDLYCIKPNFIPIAKKYHWKFDISY